jgi:hypothetical protein
MLGDEDHRHLTAAGESLKVRVRATSDRAQVDKLKEVRNVIRVAET